MKGQFAAGLVLAVASFGLMPLPQGGGERAVLVGAGDIANCEVAGGAGALHTGRVLDTIEGTVFTTGDHAYPSGDARSFEECYDPRWGRHKDRTRPSPGNHDLLTDGGAAYFEYFGEQAGPDRRGYYSYKLGEWLILSLNSATDAGAASQQIKWLREELADSQATCTLAYWHVPVFSSGTHGSNPKMLEAWKVLYEFNADVVVNGHDHVYERFAPQNPAGKKDDARGIRAFTVGTGGGGVYGFKRVLGNSEVRGNKSYGLVKFTLEPDGYSWEFVRAFGEPFEDKGSARCVR